MACSQEATSLLIILCFEGAMRLELHGEVPQIFGESGGEVPGTKRGFVCTLSSPLESYGLNSSSRQNKPHK